MELRERVDHHRSGTEAIAMIRVHYVRNRSTHAM